MNKFVKRAEPLILHYAKWYDSLRCLTSSRSYISSRYDPFQQTFDEQSKKLDCFVTIRKKKIPKRKRSRFLEGLPVKWMTPVVHFTNILQADFAPILFCRIITNPNCKCTQKLLIKCWWNWHLFSFAGLESLGDVDEVLRRAAAVGLDLLQSGLKQAIRHFVSKIKINIWKKFDVPLFVFSHFRMNQN